MLYDSAFFQVSIAIGLVCIVPTVRARPGAKAAILKRKCIRIDKNRVRMALGEVISREHNGLKFRAFYWDIPMIRIVVAMILVLMVIIVGLVYFESAQYWPHLACVLLSLLLWRLLDNVNMAISVK